MFEYGKTYFGYDVEVGLDIESNTFVGFLIGNGMKSVYSYCSDIVDPENCNVDKHVNEVLKVMRDAALEYAAIHGTVYEISPWEQKQIDEFKVRGNFRIFKASEDNNSNPSGKERP